MLDESDESDAASPVAIIGMSCRLPGEIDSPEEFWNFLLEAGDGIGELPPGRWTDTAGVKSLPTAGGFREDIHGFDAAFFGVSPREAALMDPQQRMTLELAWEALENAGVRPSELAGTDAGVYVGVNADDHGRRLLSDLPSIEAWSGIGSSLCAVANRVSYALDVRGPSMAVDTACSASLVAIHLACQGLRAGDASLALAGGVMLMAEPGLTAVMHTAGALSPSGRSRPFDAAADGYVRGEGAGLLVLKRLADAHRDGDRVLALVRGSVVRQDGRTDGIMAPNADAQEQLIRDACAAAGVEPAAVDYVEAHGTGTRAGDPVEATALARTYGSGRVTPCLIGSVKANIGHLEAASGVAGVIKVVLALRHGILPATPHAVTPSPAIPWDSAGLQVVAESTPWPCPARARVAGVSGYGYGGTIAHLVLAADPEPAKTSHDDAVPRSYLLSGASAWAVEHQAERLARWLDGNGAAAPLQDVAHTLAHRRDHVEWRAAVVASGRTELRAGLDKVDAVRATATGGEPVWVFSGHGSQWPGGGRRLLATEPAFRAVLDRLAPVFREEYGRTAEELLCDDRLDTPDAQVLIFACQVALAATWRRYGVRPAAVIGHSVGEIAAAVVAGALSEGDGARLVCRRSTLLRRVAGGGAMAIVNLPFDEVSEQLRGLSDVAVAIEAAPRSTVITGRPDAVGAVVRRWRAESGTAVQEVATDIAFHGPDVACLLDELERAARRLVPRDPTIPLYSTVSDDPRHTARRDGAYWAANLGGVVRFRQAVGAALADGHRVFLEVSCHPVVSHAVAETAAEAGVPAADVVVAHTLRRNRPEPETLLHSANTLYRAGVELDWAAVQPGGALADVPGVAWRRRQHRVEPAVTARGRHDPGRHDLLGDETTVHGHRSIRAWHTVLTPANRPYPGNHPVLGTEIVPAAVLLNTFRVAGATSVLTDVALRTPVPVDGDRELEVSLVDGRLRLSTRTSSAQDWLTHTTAVVADDSEWRARPDGVPEHGEPLDPRSVASALAEVGVEDMGFRWRIEELSRPSGGLLARVRTSAVADSALVAALDAALSVAATALPGPATLRMPSRIRRVAVSTGPATDIMVNVEVTAPDTVDVSLLALDGDVLAELSGLRFGTLAGDATAQASPRRLVHELRWEPVSVPDRDHHIDGLVFVGASPPGELPVPSRWVARAEDLDAIEAELTETTPVIVVPRTDMRRGVGAFHASWLLLRTAERLARRRGGDRPRLWCLTRGVLESDVDTALDQSSLWGVGRVLANEHPDLWGGLVDLDAGDDGRALLDVLRRGKTEEIVAVRDGEARQPKLAPLVGTAWGRPLSCRPEGTYLVTGGLGAVGREVAQWLAERGARRLVLASRHGLPARELWDEIEDPEQLARVDCVRRLESAGVTVRAPALDVTDRVQAPKLLSAAELGLPPFTGVVHAAGVLDSRFAADVDARSLITVMRPKVAGALVLHRMFPPGSLDFFVLFSSAGPLLGLPGQASYAAANAFLDSLATHRRSAGDAGAVSLAWSSWRGLGMSASSGTIDAELRARGVGDITAEEAFDAWDHAQHGDAQLAVLRAVTPPPGARRQPLLRDVATPAPPPQQEEPVLAPWSPEGVLAEVTASVTAELQLPEGELDIRRPLAELGADSVLTQQIRLRLERRFGLNLPANLLWSAPTASALSEHLVSQLQLSQGGAE